MSYQKHSNVIDSMFYSIFKKEKIYIIEHILEFVLVCMESLREDFPLKIRDKNPILVCVVIDLSVESIIYDLPCILVVHDE